MDHRQQPHRRRRPDSNQITVNCIVVQYEWTLPPPILADNIGHPVSLSTLLMMARLVAAVATLGGALGSGMEDDEAVKAAAYGVQQRQRFDKPE